MVGHAASIRDRAAHVVTRDAGLDAGRGTARCAAIGPRPLALGLALLLPAAALRAQAESLYAGGSLTSSATLVVADIDHDGRDDLLSFAAFGPNVAVRRAHPDGTWGPPANFAAGNTGLAVGDCNGDGHPDIVSARVVPASLRTAIGTGTGSFGPPVTTPASYVAANLSLSLADFDGDGLADLVVNSPLSLMPCNCLHVSLGVGDGTFGGALQVDVGFKAQSVLVDDFSGDGALDILALSLSDGGIPQIVLARGDGAGGFLPAVSTETPPFAVGTAAAARLDGDDLPDLAVTAWNENVAAGLVLYRNAGDGTFQQVAAFPLIEFFPVLEGTPGWPAIADFDADGLPDVAVSAPGIGLPSQSGLWFLRGLGGFALQAPAFTDANRAGRVFVTDIDHDGRRDLLLRAPVGAEPLGLLFGTGDGGFEVAGVVDAAAPTGALAAGDVDGDRRPDLVLAVVDDAVASLRVRLGSGDGSFVAGPDVVGVPPVTRVALGDVSGDGVLDAVVAAGAPPQSVHVLPGAGDGSFLPAQPHDGGAVTDLLLADVDGGGGPDIVTTAADGLARVLLNTGGGTFAPALPVHTGGDAAALAAGDVDEDGVPDLCVAHAAPGKVAVILGLGGGAFGAPVLWPGLPGAADVLLADVNGDGHLDLGTTGDVTRLLLGAGDGTFAAPLDVDQAQPAAALLAADVNADGLPDVVLAPRVQEPEAESVLTILFGRPDGASFSETRYACGGAVTSAEVLDANLDGFADLALADALDQGVEIFLNRSDVWATLGHGLSATFGTPLLAGAGLPIPDGAVTLTASELPAGATGLLVAGLQADFLPLHGGTLVPALDLLQPIVADLPLAGRWPTGVPTGTPVYFQAWFVGSASGLPAGDAAASNALVTLSR